jgi:hypothetical protein
MKKPINSPLDSDAAAAARWENLCIHYWNTKDNHHFHNIVLIKNIYIIV